MCKFHLYFVATTCLGMAALANANNDPTYPLRHIPSESAENRELRLNSVLISNSRRVAVINGQLVAEGDTIAGATLIRILDNRVQVTINGKNRELKLHTTTVKRAVKRARK